MSFPSFTHAAARGGAGDRIRIAYLVYGTGLGGGESVLAEHLAHADRTRFEPLVVVTGPGALEQRLRDIGVETVRLPLHREASVFGRLNRPHLSTLLRLARVVTARRCALVHSYTLETRNYAHALALLTGKPLVHTSQDTWFGTLFGRGQWWAMNHIPARIVATSDTVVDSLKVGTRLAPGKVRVIKPGIDLGRYRIEDDAADTRSSLGIPAGAPVVGIVGRYSAAKGYDTFVAAAALLVRRFPAVRFLVVGGAVLRDDDYGPELERLIAAHGLAPSFVLTGFRDDVPRLIRAMDVLVSSSPRESFGLTLAEAAACARPVVATRSGGAQEIVVDGETGLLVPVGSPRALADGVAALLEDAPRAQRMGRAGRSRAVRLFDIRRMVREIEAEYLAVLGQRAAPHVEETRCVSE